MKGELTGRVCDDCEKEEVLMKIKQLLDKKCGCCDGHILLCWDCMRFNIDHSQIYPCKVCRRDIKITQLGI